MGTGACASFSGKVCKDGSCDGIKSCYQATIPWVVNSCKGGDYACREADNVGNIVNSCQGPAACYELGHPGGKVGEIRDSCIGERACVYISYGDGQVGNIVNSCNAKQACESVADQDFSLPNQGDIVDQCNTYKSCYKLNFVLTAKPSAAPTTTPTKAGKNKKKAKSSKPTQAPTISAAPTTSAAPVKAKTAKKKSKIANLFN